MLIIRGPIIPCIFWIKIILAIFLPKTRPDKTIFSVLTNLTIDFDWSKELSKIEMQNPQCLLCLFFFYINVLFWKIIFMETYYSWSLPLSYFADFTLYVLCCYKLLKTLFVVHIDAPPHKVWALTRPGDRKGAPAHNWLLLNISPLDTTGRHHDHQNHHHHHHPLLNHQHYHHHHNLFVNLVSLC